MLAIGILFGLCAAMSQSLSYLFSRSYATSGRGSRLQLLVLSQVIQGAICLPLVPLLWPADAPPIGQWIVPMLTQALFYLIAQMFLFTALRHTEASRVSPLLGIKIALLALLTMGLLGDAIGSLQWMAVGLAVAGAFVLNYTGGSIPLPAVLGVFGAVGCYSLSDFSIRVSIDQLSPVSRLNASMFSLVCAYTVGAVMVLPLLPRLGSRRLEPWRAAAPFALSWLIAMGFLYLCFASAGLVLGGIVQSTRGLISIGLGALLASRGLEMLEKRVAPIVFWRRVGAAVMMMLAVALFAIGKSRVTEVESHEPVSRISDQAGAFEAGHVVQSAGLGTDRPYPQGQGGDLR